MRRVVQADWMASRVLALRVTRCCSETAAARRRSVRAARRSDRFTASGDAVSIANVYDRKIGDVGGSVGLLRKENVRYASSVLLPVPERLIFPMRSQLIALAFS